MTKNQNIYLIYLNRKFLLIDIKIIVHTGHTPKIIFNVAKYVSNNIYIHVYKNDKGGFLCFPLILIFKTGRSFWLWLENLDFQGVSVCFGLNF